MHPTSRQIQGTIIVECLSIEIVRMKIQLFFAVYIDFALSYELFQWFETWNEADPK